MRAAQDRVPFHPRRQRDRAMHRRPGALGGVDDLERGAVEHLVVVALHSDADPFIGKTGHEVTPSGPSDEPRTVSNKVGTRVVFTATNPVKRRIPKNKPTGIPARGLFTNASYGLGIGGETGQTWLVRLVR